MLIDTAHRTATFRIVFAGGPRAGKTELVRTLASVLHGAGSPVSVYSPGDADGRTLYFDWLEYTGGINAGFRIRCQILTVPGQDVLAHRRRRLIELADVVMLVIDSRPTARAASQHALRELLDWSAQRDVAAPTLLIANKQDLPDALDAARIRADLPDALRDHPIYETVATTGDGLRMAFVNGVREAIEAHQDALEAARGDADAVQLDSPEDVLALLRDADAAVTRAEPPAPGPNVPETRHTRDPDAWFDDPGRVRLIWPRRELAEWLSPHDRARLAAADRTPGQFSATPLPGGASMPLDAARTALTDLARSAHAMRQVLPDDFGLLAVSGSGGEHRLWRIERLPHPLVDKLPALLDGAPHPLANRLLRLSGWLRLIHTLGERHGLGAHLRAAHIGMTQRRVVYTGPIDARSGEIASTSTPRDTVPGLNAFVADCLDTPLRARLGREHAQAAALMVEIERLGATSASAHADALPLLALLLEH